MLTLELLKSSLTLHALVLYIFFRLVLSQRFNKAPLWTIGASSLLRTLFSDTLSYKFQVFQILVKLRFLIPQCNAHCTLLGSPSLKWDSERTIKEKVKIIRPLCGESPFAFYWRSWSFLPTWSCARVEVPPPTHPLLFLLKLSQFLSVRIS